MTLSNACAFPADYNTHGEGGLTKREYFAALAMQGIVSTGLLTMQSYGLEFTWEHREKYLSQISVRIADALIEELNIIKSDESD